MHFTQVKITRDEMTGLLVHVGAWEVPLLEAKHGEGKIEVGELKEFKGRPWPENVRSEMQRLNTLYGMRGTGDSAISFAEFVYGAGTAGLKALEAAMKDAVKAAQPKGKRKPKEDLVGASASA